MKNLRIARKRAGLTQKDIAKIIGLSQNQYSNWETGKSKIDNEQLTRLAEILEVSVDYLLDSGRIIPLRHNSAGIRIPVLGTVAAGIPIDAIEEIVDWEEIPQAMAHQGEFFGLRIKGRSMEPRIMQGDTVIVRKQEDISSGDIAIVLVNGEEGTCKKVQKHENGGMTLIGLNAAAFEPTYYTPEEIRSLPLVIVGKVVELRGKM